MDPKYEAAKVAAPEISAAILRASNESRNEAELRGKIHHILQTFAELNGIGLETREEYSVASGRVDTIYNRLVIEYKSPGKLRESARHKPTEDAILQLNGYVQSLADLGSLRPRRIAGVVTDGRLMVFIRTFPSGYVTDPPVKVNPQSTERLLKYLVSLKAGIAILPENLIRDFGLDNERTRKLILALYQTLRTTEIPIVGGLFRQWDLYFSEVAGYEVDSPRFSEKEGVRRLIQDLDLKVGDVNPAQLFFAVHTYYALLIKLLAWLSVSPYIGRRGYPFGTLVQADLKELRRHLQKLEQGGVFRDLGIVNFLEGDFFSWYLQAWEEGIGEPVHEIVSRLSDYDPGTIELNPEGTRDLLKRLYQFLMPREARHDLGEYYTPDWLAQLTLNRLDSTDVSLSFSPALNTKVLDPACGSGTFLILTINAIKRRGLSEGSPPKDILRAILANVVGIDLNPLAVIAARTNYLLAIQELLDYRDGEISIPVYLADSISVPTASRTIQTYGDIVVRTAVGDFVVPAELATTECMDVIAPLIDECVEQGAKLDVFLERAGKSLPKSVFESSKERLGSLYSQMLRLHETGLDGIWSRILKNAFAPLYIGNDFDFVVGNPPWINWESLPDRYRLETKPLWVAYGLFPHHGMDTVLGKGKKDISMLMTYSVMDRHLKTGGRLAFVITQSLFKSTASGQGFRTFKLGTRRTPIKVVSVDDLVDLNPFEGATNRTAVMVLQKGAATSFPVPYIEWRRRAHGSIPFDAPFHTVLERCLPGMLAAEPVVAADPTSGWMTAPATLLPALRKILGASAYQAHAGVNTGGANGAYWIEILHRIPGGLVLARNFREGTRREVKQIEAPLEDSLVWPLIRGRDVERWVAKPSLHILFVQDPKTREGIPERELQTKFPRAYQWLKGFEVPLRKRAAFLRYFTTASKAGKVTERAPFYSMFNVAQYSLSEWKVVWKEQAAEMTAAVVGPEDGAPCLPDHKLMMVECGSGDEAHYLAGCLNSRVVRLGVASYAIQIQMDTHILETIAIPQYTKADSAHQSIARTARQAQKLAIEGRKEDLARLERELDRLVAALWGVRAGELWKPEIARQPAPRGEVRARA
jgi:SAM-dependent methyltransferase